MKSPSAHLHVRLEDVPEVTLVPARFLTSGSIGAKIAYGVQSSLMVATRQPGYHSRPHRHKAEQLNYVLDGELHVFVDDDGCRVVPHAVGGDEKVAWPSHRAVSFVKEYMHAYYAEDTSLGALAALAGIDKYHLLRAFKRDVGLPPHRYRTHVRIAHARRLIAEGVSLVDVALKVGFASQSRFHDSFRAIVGVSPGRYRRQLAR